MAQSPMREPTDEEMDERYRLEGDPEEALRRFLTVDPDEIVDSEEDDATTP